MFNPLVKPKASLNRNGFDKSCRRTYSQRIGEILPALVLHTVPGDHFEINPASLVKTLPVRTDAFARVKQNFEFFFVPYKQLWNDWDSFVLQRQFMVSSEQRKNLAAPCFGLNNFLSECASVVNLDGKTEYGDSSVFNVLKLAEMLGYGSLQSRLQMSTGSPSIPDYSPFESEKYVNLFAIGAYNKIWYDYYRNKFYDVDPELVKTWNFDDFGLIFDHQNDPSFQDSVFDNVRTDPLIFAENLTNYNKTSSLFRVRYRQWKKDLFTSAMPTPQFGQVSAVDLKGVNIINNKSFSTSVAAQIRGQSADTLPASGLYASSSGSANWDIDNAFNVYDIKRAEMIQKWRETVLRAGDNIQSQYKGRFGVHSKYNADSDVDFLGSYSNEVEINPVYNTAAGANFAQLGEVAGRGQALGSGRKIVFDAQDYGVIMCMTYFMPETEYDAGGIDKFNTFSDPFDFFTPEFEDLGLSPVFQFELDANGQPVAASYPGNLAITDAQFNKVLGYTSRYHEYKTDIDKCFGEFSSRSPRWLDAAQSFGGIYQSWVIPRGISYIIQPLRLKDYYVNPFADESIFMSSNPYVNDPDAWTYDDHYLVSAYFDVKAVRPMSLLGLPQW